MRRERVFAMTRTDDADMTGRTIDHYSIVALIAAGGQGRVYRGRDERLQRAVAIKVLGADRASDPAARRNLIMEARALSRLNHPHVAAVYDFVTQGGCDYLVMEFVPGATLRDFLAGGPLPAGEVLRLGGQMAQGLACAHRANLVHRDIKPGNLKITSSGELKILDFGLAKLLPGGTIFDDGSGTTISGAVVGTVPYMAPERLRGEDADQRSDIFSVGAVLYEMATGVPAYPQRNLADLVEGILQQEPLPPSAVNPHVPLALERVIVKALRKEPAARYENAAALAASLDALVAGSRPGPRRVLARQRSVCGAVARLVGV
jgi:serine/threonine protein kinase